MLLLKSRKNTVTTRTGAERELERQRAAFLEAYEKASGCSMKPELLDELTRVIAFDDDLGELFASLCALQWLVIDYDITEF